MSQTKQQQPGAAPAEAKPRKDWELFWRIIAVLMIAIIGWVIWVLYQITPRSVVTPLVYESQIKRIGAQPTDAGASTQPTPAATQPSPELAAAALRMDEEQAAMRAGAHQGSADVQAAALEGRVEPVRGEKLKLSTEITTPLAERQSTPEPAGAAGAPASPAAPAEKARP